MAGVPLLEVSQVTTVATDRTGQTEAGDWEAADDAGEREGGVGGHQAGLHVSVEGAVLSHLSALSEKSPVVEEVTVGSDCSPVELTVRLVQQATPRLAVPDLQSGRLLDGLVLLAGLGPGVGASVPLGEERLQPGVRG